MRTDFHAEIDRMLDLLVAGAEIADGMLDGALKALTARDTALAAEVVARDGEVDDRYAQVQQGIVRLFALQAPVASDLRRLSAMLHVNIHVERFGDYAVNVARTAERSSDLTDDPELTRQLTEMGAAARAVGQASLRSFVARDIELARSLPDLDDRVDQLNRSIFQRLVTLAAEDTRRLAWATNVLLVPRAIERYGDHAVDIGEQTIFAVTGTSVELSSNAPGG